MPLGALCAVPSEGHGGSSHYLCYFGHCNNRNPGLHWESRGNLDSCHFGGRHYSTVYSDNVCLFLVFLQAEEQAAPYIPGMVS